MKCPNCGTENEVTSNRKFCVKCGTNLINPDEINIEQVDFGGYHNEENKENFKISQGTFKINDRIPQTASMFVSSEELNQSYDDFDDEPYIPQLDSERVKLPEQPENPPVQPELQSPVPNNNNMYPQQPNGMYPQGMNNPYMQNMYGYGQPMMQPQFVGYDANGMPVYAQVMMMPQFVGYDMNGMPIYMPMPVYPQNMQNPQGFPNVQPMQPNMQNPQGFPNVPPVQPNMQNPQGFPNIQPMQPNMQNPQNLHNHNNDIAEPKEQEKESLWSDFLEEDVKKSAPNNQPKKVSSDDDFFSNPQRSNNNMGGVSAEGLDFSKLERHKKEKKNKYMSSAPEADASCLSPNVNRGNGKYMKDTAIVNPDELEQHVTKKPKTKMKASLEVNADELEQFVRKSPEVIMNSTQKADASELKAYKHEHVEAIMQGADKAVEAMPKKKVYVDELEQIELPVYMKAKKSKANESGNEIPSLPDI